MSRQSKVIPFKKRFKFAESVKVPFPKKIYEGFERKGDSLLCSISFEKLEPILMDFIEKLSEPLFMVVQLPLCIQEEEKLQEKGKKKTHDEVLYLDGCSKEDIYKIWKQHGEILLKDGISQFAVASHKTGDEMFVQKYKVVSIFCNEKAKYIDLLRQYGIEETKTLLTVWKTISRQHPGMCRRIEIDDKDIYEVVEALKQKGMYRAKIVEI